MVHKREGRGIAAEAQVLDFRVPDDVVVCPEADVVAIRVNVPSDAGLKPFSPAVSLAQYRSRLA
jgi:hypothetical protein